MSERKDTNSVNAGTRIRTVIHGEVGPHFVLEWIVTSALLYLKWERIIANKNPQLVTST
jgi:hypothetical protein